MNVQELMRQLLQGCSDCGNELKLTRLISETKSGLGPEVIKLFSCSTQLSMKFFLLINIKMPAIVGILTVMSRKNSILGLSEPIKS